MTKLDQSKPPQPAAAPTVIVTRPAPDGEALADQLRRYGFTPILSPAMSVQFKDTRLDVSAIAALVFTSANGVRAFVHCCDERELPVFAVGAATAQLAKEAGFSQIVEAGGDLDSLAEKIRATQIDGPHLQIAGHHRAGDLAALLDEADIAVERAVLYEALAHPILDPSAAAALHAGGVQQLWVALFSPRTAQLFMDQARQSGIDDFSAVKAICLSRAVADILEGHGFCDIAIAPSRTADALIEHLAELSRA